jgi:hypothetical protein
MASIAVGLLPWLVGCGDSKKTVYKASGIALYDDNTPLKNVRLNFYPSAALMEGENAPHAETDENGKFQLSTYGDNDGAPAGEYKVTVSPAAPMLKPPGPGEKPTTTPGKMPQMTKLDVASEYLTPEKTTAKVTITTGDNSQLKVQVKRAAAPGS